LSASLSKEVIEEKIFQQRKYIHEDTEHPNWSKHHKHVFVLSNAGKPIYSRYGDEQNISPFMASLTALVSFVQDMNDNIRYIVAGNHKVVFLVKGSIILVTVSQTHEPVSQLIQQLNYIHSQMLSILTGRVTQIYEKRAQFDLRTLLGSADRFLDNLISLMDHDLSFLLNSIHCLRLDINVRNTISNVIQLAETKDLLYAMVIAKYQLVNLIRPRKYILQPADLHLIMNFVNSSTSFKNSESWTPICLPKFNDQGYLHAYVYYLAEDICLLLISTQAESFYQLSGCKNSIVTGLNKFKVLDQITKAIQANSYSVSEIGFPSLLHFVYKSNNACQCTAPRFEVPYIDRHDQKQLIRLYQRVHARVHRFKSPHKVYYQVTETETVVGWVTSGFELYATFGPLEPKSSCIKGCNQILNWIKNEENNLFILNSPIW